MKTTEPPVPSSPAPAEVVGTESSKAKESSLQAVAWKPRGSIELVDWIRVGERFGSVSRGHQWWIGDWLNYGNERWGEKYAEAGRITGYDPGTLRNIAWVASQFEDPSRRRDKLSWSHHAVLASSTFDDGERERWLQRSIDDRLSVADLRLEINALRKRARSSADSSIAEEAQSESSIACPQCGFRIEG